MLAIGQLVVHTPVFHTGTREYAAASIRVTLVDSRMGEPPKKTFLNAIADALAAVRAQGEEISTAAMVELFEAILKVFDHLGPVLHFAKVMVHHCILHGVMDTPSSMGAIQLPENIIYAFRATCRQNVTA